jgi:hypothetical protein
VGVDHILDKSARVPSTFLDLKSLSDEVLKTYLDHLYLQTDLQDAAIFVGFAGLLIALIAIFFPIAYGVSAEWMSRKMDIQNIQNELEQMKKVSNNDKAVSWVLRALAWRATSEQARICDATRNLTR